MTITFQLIERAPSADEYRAVCTGVGWGKFMNFDAAAKALKNSLFHVVVEHDGTVIAMGRIVGDGALYFYIQDLAVLPEYQGRGIGRMILKRLMAYLHDHAPRSAFIGLFTGETNVEFYRQYGFVKSVGMFQYKQDE